MEARSGPGSGGTAKIVGVYAGGGTRLASTEAAVDKTGPEALGRILESLQLNSMERVDNLETLKEIVLKLEEVAAEAH
jgi:hypothetical protein